MAPFSPKCKSKMVYSDHEGGFNDLECHSPTASSSSTIADAHYNRVNAGPSTTSTSTYGEGISGMVRSRTMTVLTPPARSPLRPGREIQLHENGNNRNAFIVEFDSPNSSIIDSLASGSVDGHSDDEWSWSVRSTSSAQPAIQQVPAITAANASTVAGPSATNGENNGIAAAPTMGTQINNLIEYVETGAEAASSEGRVSNLGRSKSMSAQHYNDSFITNIGGCPTEYTAKVNAQNDRVNMQLKRTISERVQRQHGKSSGSGSTLFKQNLASVSEKATIEHKLYHRGLAHQSLVGSTDEEAIDVISNYTPASPVSVAGPSNRIPASSSATIVTRDFSVSHKERRALKRLAREYNLDSGEPLTSDNLEQLAREANAYQQNQRELVGLSTNDNSGGDHLALEAPMQPTIPPQANIPGFDNEGSYQVAVRNISQLDLGVAASTAASACGSSSLKPLVHTQSVLKKCKDASRQLIAKNIAAVASADHERRRQTRDKATETTAKLTNLSADADSKYIEAVADSKKMKTTPMPSEVAKIEEAKSKERFRRKVPEFWCRLCCFKA